MKIKFQTQYGIILSFPDKKQLKKKFKKKKKNEKRY